MKSWFLFRPEEGPSEVQSVPESIRAPFGRTASGLLQGKSPQFTIPKMENSSFRPRFSWQFHFKGARLNSVSKSFVTARTSVLLLGNTPPAPQESSGTYSRVGLRPGISSLALNSGISTSACFVSFFRSLAKRVEPALLFASRSGSALCP